MLYLENTAVCLSEKPCRFNRDISGHRTGAVKEETRERNEEEKPENREVGETEVTIKEKEQERTDMILIITMSNLPVCVCVSCASTDVLSHVGMHICGAQLCPCGMYFWFCPVKSVAEGPAVTSLFDHQHEICWAMSSAPAASMYEHYGLFSFNVLEQEGDAGIWYVC